MAMDIARPDLARKRKRRRIVYGAVLVVAVGLATLGLSRLKPAPPSVDRAVVLIDTVHRGDMIREEHGLGTLVPAKVTSIPAITDGRVEQRLVLTGMAVKPDTILLVLSNPELLQKTQDAGLTLKADRAQYANLQAQLQSQYLGQQASLAQAESNYKQVKLKADADGETLKLGLSPRLQYEQDLASEEAAAETAKMSRLQLAQFQQQMKTQLAAQQTKIDQDRAELKLDQDEVAELNVRAGMAGVLQELDVGTGDEVGPGKTLAKVVDPNQLWAELDIPETEAKDLLLSQTATVDTHNGIIPGHVIRIAPSPVNGTVAVDVSLDAPLPKGARPDLSVEGTILIEKLVNVMYVQRPVHAEADSTIGLFKLVGGGKEAVRVQVRIGKVSVNTVQILGGLQVGDQVILSDMSADDNFDRIRLD